jgi:hypothetical protein
MTEKQKRILSFRRRFVKDFNLPINVVDSPYFEYYMDTYDWFPKDEYFALCDEIREKYEGNHNLWLEDYSRIRDEIITEIENSEEYKKFNSMDMNEWALSDECKNLPDVNIYNQSSVGKTFLSIDLKKANFQALRKVGVIDANTYEDFIGKWTDSEYFKKSKYTRQVIFGKLNPKRTIAVEKKIMEQVKRWFETYKFKGLKLVAFKADELIYEITETNPKGWEEHLEYEMKSADIRVEIFTIGRIECKNHNDVTVDCYIRKCHTTGEETLKSTSQIFYPQLYKIWKGDRITLIDQYFLAEGQLASFEYPLELISIS